MRLGLADVKKRVVRRQGEAYLVPHLLRRGELRAEIGALIALYEEWLGRTRGEFPADRAAELIGDYRLARGLEIVLTDYYIWSAPAWPGPASDTEAQALAAHGIAAPGSLRLALYDEVNARHGGYLPGVEREPALNALAAEIDLERPTLDALLTLDADEHARLARAAPGPPTAVAVSALYNLRAVEALLANAALVEWRLLPSFAAQLSTSLGTMLKRICFLARRMGVYYDVAFAEGDESAAPLALPRVAEGSAPYTADAGRAAPRSGPLDRALCVTLYGPQEAFGAPNQYGDRLARLCRTLLGRQWRGALEGAGAAHGGLHGEAHVYLHGRRFRFALDEQLLALLGGPEHETAETKGAAEPTVAFDSELERGLYQGFVALERTEATHGWRMEREPEPILSGETILIPDFALARGGQRVYLEVAGYWSPAYRERKRRKLAALAGRVELAIAAPEEARAELESLAETFPVLWFKDRISPQALINLLETRYDDFAVRRAQVRHSDVLAEVERRGVLPWGECAAALRAYGQAELAAVAADLAVAAQRAEREPPLLIDNLGLTAPSWLARVEAAITSWVSAAGPDGLPLSGLLARLSEVAPGLAAQPAAEEAAEAIAWASGLVVLRASLFEPRVVLREIAGRSAEDAAPKVAATIPQPRRHRRRNTQREEMPSQGHLLAWDPTAE